MINSKYVLWIYSAVLFFFIFSIYNDNFVVDYLGPNSLKIIFLLFLIVNIAPLYRNFTNKSILKEALPFYAFAAVLLLMILINPPQGGLAGEKAVSGALLIFSMLIIVSFFISYNLEKVLYFIWISLLVSSVISFFSNPITEYTFRKTGGTGDPNEFAAQMITFLFVSIYLHSKNKNLYFLVVSALAFLYSILFAASLSSFISLAILGVLILLRYLSLSVKKTIIISVISLALLILTGFLFRQNIKELEVINDIIGRTENLRTADVRIKNFKAGAKMIIAKPLTGVGMGEYVELSRGYSRNRLRKDAIAPHNIYIHVFAESGIFAFLSFAYFLYTLLTKRFKKLLHLDYFWIYVAVIGGLLMGFTIGITYSKFLWLTIALLMNIQHNIKERKNLVPEEIVCGP